MNKRQFLNRLDESLQALSKMERQDIIHDFEEHFTFGEEEGKTEEEIAASLGSVEKIADELLAAHQVEENTVENASYSTAKSVAITIGLILFNLTIIVGPFFGVVGALFGGWVASISFVVSPLLFLINMIIFPGSFIMFELFVVIGLCGLGLLIGILMFLASKGIFYLTKRYVQFNIQLVKGGV